jgi:hypothetical protein
MRPTVPPPCWLVAMDLRVPISNRSKQRLPLALFWWLFGCSRFPIYFCPKRLKAFSGARSMILGLRRVVSSLELCYGALFVRMRRRSGPRGGYLLSAVIYAVHSGVNWALGHRCLDLSQSQTRSSKVRDLSFDYARLFEHLQRAESCLVDWLFRGLSVAA